MQTCRAPSGCMFSSTTRNKQDVGTQVRTLELRTAHHLTANRSSRYEAVLIRGFRPATIRQAVLTAAELRAFRLTLPPLFIQWDLESDGWLKCSPKLGQLMLEFSGV
jgi:hypothetical protein